MTPCSVAMLDTGVMHPDLFNGETPLLIPVPVPEAPRAWHVWIANCYVWPRWRRVIACTEEEACEIVDAHLVNIGHSDSWADFPEWSFRRITADEVAAYLLKRLKETIQ